MTTAKWSHGWRLVLRRVYELFVGPKPSVHAHLRRELWQFPTAFPLAFLLAALGVISWWAYLPLAFVPIPVPFLHWQRPVTDSAYHFEKLGIDILIGPWTFCFHYIDN